MTEREGGMWRERERDWTLKRIEWILPFLDVRERLTNAYNTHKCQIFYSKLKSEI